MHRKVTLLFFMYTTLQGGRLLAAELDSLLLREDHVWFEDRWMIASCCDE
jgi:hypothetical protein